MSLLTLPIRRPVAVAMFFLGIVLVGAVAWQRMPVELFPALAGDRLFVNFGRQRAPGHRARDPVALAGSGLRLASGIGDVG